MRTSDLVNDVLSMFGLDFVDEEKYAEIVKIVSANVLKEVYVGCKLDDTRDEVAQRLIEISANGFLCGQGVIVGGLLQSINKMLEALALVPVEQTDVASETAKVAQAAKNGMEGIENLLTNMKERGKSRDSVIGYALVVHLLSFEAGRQ